MTVCAEKQCGLYDNVCAEKSAVCMMLRAGNECRGYDGEQQYVQERSAECMTTGRIKAS